VTDIANTDEYEASLPGSIRRGDQPVRDHVLRRPGRRARPSPACTAPFALRYTAGPQAALDELDALGDALGSYHLYHGTRAELLRALGHLNQARGADERALDLTANPAEAALLQQRISWALSGVHGSSL
jgi:hypothetical protein